MENSTKQFQERVTYVNGKWVDESKASIHIYDSQFMFGDGVFEMHRTFGHKHFLLDEHIERLFRSMKYVCIPSDKTKGEIVSLCDEVIERNLSLFPADEEFRFMINVSRGPLSIYREVFELSEGDSWDKPTWIINAYPLSKVAKTLAHFYDVGANAVVTSQRQIPARLLEAKVKNRSRLHYQMANIEASKHGFDAMPLLLDEDGFVSESTGANFMMVKDGVLVVPELRNMLRGCSMMYIIERLCPMLGLSVIEKNFDVYDVLDADEAMFTGTFVNLLPCNRINGVLINEKLKDAPMGPVTKRICDQWSKNVGTDFIDQIRIWKNG